MTEILIVDAERPSTYRALTERILVRAPNGDDGRLIAEILGSRGFEVVVLADVASLAAEWNAGAGVLLIASEALNDSGCCGMLRQLSEAQEPWSELPVLLLGGSGEEDTPRVNELLGDRVQILILERPVGIATFVSATDAALRSRRRQYEVKKLLDELAASAVAIARAHDQIDHAKDEFLATLAHELRSPMTAIRGWVEMLKMGDLDPADAVDALSMIESSANVQARIVEDLMDMSRIIAGKVMIEPVVVPLGPLVQRIVSGFRPAASAAGIKLTAEISEEELIVLGDAVRLHQVASNLLSNALKFTPRGGSVGVRLTRENGSAVIRVRDSGQGISPELLPHVFERYRQEEGEHQRAHHGLGLGLAIVHHLVKGHGGTIAAFSDGLDQGAEFVVSLPLPSPALDD